MKAPAKANGRKRSVSRILAETHSICSGFTVTYTLAKTLWGPADKVYPSASRPGIKSFCVAYGMINLA